MNQYGVSPWTDERVAALRELWAAGLSASQVARKLGFKTSRNAVIGKIHRMGLTGRARNTDSQKMAARIAARRKKRSMVFVPNAVLRPTRGPALRAELAGIKDLAPLPFEGGPRTILTIRDGECRFPIGDPQDEAFAFCGRGACGTYCAQHQRLAYEPSRKRRQEDASIARITRWLDRKAQRFEAAA